LIFRPCMFGQCFLCRLRISVNPFPMWTALPPSEYYGLIRLPGDHRLPFFSSVRLPDSPSHAASATFRVRLTSVSGFPPSWLTIRISCVSVSRTIQHIRNRKGLPSSRRFSSRIPRSSWTPADPPGPHPYRSLRVGFWVVNTIAICFIRFNGAVSSFGDCGLRDSLCTLQLLRSGFSSLLHSCNTRHEWLVRPYSAVTLARPEAPSFAWRTNDKAHLPGPHSEVRTSRSSDVGRVRCSAWFGVPSGLPHCQAPTWCPEAEQPVGRADVTHRPRPGSLQRLGAKQGPGGPAKLGPTQ